MTLLGAFSASHGFVNSLHRSRKLDQLVGRAPRPLQQFAAAVRANTCQFHVCAGGTKGAFKGADAGIRRVGRQIGVAAFAVGA